MPPFSSEMAFPFPVTEPGSPLQKADFPGGTAAVIDKYRSHSEGLAALPVLISGEHEAGRILNCRVA